MYVEDTENRHRLKENELKQLLDSGYTDIWASLNTMKMSVSEEKEELINVIAEEVKTDDVLGVMLRYGLDTVKGMDSLIYKLCEQALIICRKMGVYSLKCGLKESVLIFVSYKIWETIEMESSSAYTPTKESIRIRNSQIDTSGMSPLEAAMVECAGYYNKVAEEIYMREPNVGKMLINHIE